MEQWTIQTGDQVVGTFTTGVENQAPALQMRQPDLLPRHILKALFSVRHDLEGGIAFIDNDIEKLAAELSRRAGCLLILQSTSRRVDEECGGV